jgi:hypothetical protein
MKPSEVSEVVSEVSSAKEHWIEMDSRSSSRGSSVLPLWCPRLILSYAANTALVVFLVASTLALRKGVIPPARRGFSCADRGITFPTKEEFLSTGILLSTGLAVTLCVVVFAEYFRNDVKNGGKHKKSIVISIDCITTGGCKLLPSWLVVRDAIHQFIRIILNSDS